MYRILILALILFTACTPVYIPNVRNSPMFTKAGEFQASVQAGNGLEAQSAYAFSDHFGAMANFSFINRLSSQDEADYHRHQFLEGGLGYFKNRTDSFFEVYAGYGRGKGTSFESFEFFGTQSTAAAGRYERYFLQPAVGINQGDLNFSFAPRFTMVDFYEFATETTRRAINEEPRFFFEPAIIGKGNFANNHMFAVFQAGACLSMNESVYFERRALQLSVGVGLRLGARKELVDRL